MTDHMNETKGTTMNETALRTAVRKMWQAWEDFTEFTNDEETAIEAFLNSEPTAL